MLPHLRQLISIALFCLALRVHEPPRDRVVLIMLIALPSPPS
jgi:hypothetical protein